MWTVTSFPNHKNGHSGAFLKAVFLVGMLGVLTACEDRHQKVASDTAQAITLRAAPVNTQGAVAAANPLAVEAGLEILREGGSAVDAAIAVQAVLGLVEPQSSGLGGGAFMIVFDPARGDVWAYDGRETAPAAITPELFYGDDNKPLRYFEGIVSGRSTGVPGVMAMLGAAHGDFGKVSWSQTLEPAIDLAEQGFTVSPRLAGLIERAQKFGFGRQSQVKNYFFEADGETPLKVGFVRDNPDYANSLRALQTNPRALLEPPIANAILAAVREEPRPGVLSLEDMANYEPKKRRAICTTYRAHTVCGAQPPSSGGIAVQSILGMVENFDIGTMGPSVDGWHVFSEASFMAYADRDKYVADDAFVDVPVNAMLGKSYLESRAGMISMSSALKDVVAGNLTPEPTGEDATPDVPGTSHFTVVDKDGLVVSMTTTVESVFGNQRMAAGFMLNNQLTDFSFKTHDADGHPIANAPAAGKRSRSSMSPIIVFDPEGKFLFSTGSPGGSAIIAYTAKTIIGILDWGLSPQAAIDLPNVIARNGFIRIEEALVDEAVITGLEARGHTIVRSQGEISGLHILYRQPDGSIIGGADTRREGIVGQVE